MERYQYGAGRQWGLADVGKSYFGHHSSDNDLPQLIPLNKQQALRIQEWPKRGLEIRFWCRDSQLNDRATAGRMQLVKS